LSHNVIESISRKANIEADKKENKEHDDVYYNSIDYMSPDVMKDYTEPLLKKIDKDTTKKFLVQRREENPEYLILLENRQNLFNQEKDIVKKARTFYTDHVLWDWCQRTRGLGDVAAMTILGYRNYCL
jgi:hypothetical protein